MEPRRSRRSWFLLLGGLTAPLTAQSNWARPALKTMIAPITSAFFRGRIVRYRSDFRTTGALSINSFKEALKEPLNNSSFPRKRESRTP